MYSRTHIKSEDEGVCLEERICQFLKDGRLLHLCHFVFFEIVDIDAVGDVAEDKREAVPVDEDL